MEHRGRGQKGPETDPKDRGRLKRLQAEVCQAMRDDAFIDTIVEAATNDKAKAELKANPKAHLKSKGIVFSDEVDVEFNEESPWCITICYGWWIFRACCRACIF